MRIPFCSFFIPHFHLIKHVKQIEENENKQMLEKDNRHTLEVVKYKIYIICQLLILSKMRLAMLIRLPLFSIDFSFDTLNEH